MITVCIATYNGAKYISEQLASILPQLDEGDEVIVSDDGSTDNTLDIVRGFGDKRISIVDGPRKGSPIWNFESAIAKAKGDYIFLADQDDVWVENKVRLSLDCLKSCDCVVSDALVADKDLRITHESFFELNGTKQGKLYNLLVKNGYLGCCMAFSRKVACDALPFPKDTPMHDIWIGNVAAFRHKVSFLPEKLIIFRRHDTTNSSTARASRYSLFKRLMFRWAIIKGLI